MSRRVLAVLLAWSLFFLLPQVASAVVLPGAFGKLTPANGAATGTSVTLSWSASTGASWYEYCYDSSNDSACTPPASWQTTTETSVTVSGLTPGGVYLWHVRAVNTAGTTESDGGGWTAWWNFWPAPLPGSFAKSAPADGATGASLTPTLSWGAASGASGYEYCYDTTPDSTCGGTWVDTGTTRTAALSGLTEDSTYYWQVRARTLSGTTDADGGTWWSFTTGTLPGAFTKTAPASGTTGTALNPALSWQSSSGATSYEYCYDTTPDSACGAAWVSTGAAATASLSGLAASTTYYWQVRARSGAGVTYADAASWWSFATAPVPGAFGKSAPADAATGVALDPTLSWASSTGATSYEYCYDMTDDGACQGSWTSTGSATSASLSGLALGGYYYWQVRAVSPAGTTPADGGTWWEFQAGMVPGPFSKISPALNSSGISLSPTLTWGASSGATSYEYCLETVGGTTCDTSWDSTGTATSVAVSGLSPGTSYWWQVRAVNAFGVTEANGGPWYLFTTGNTPRSFAKAAPGNGATGVSLSPVLGWGAADGAVSYEYCYDTTPGTTCEGTWTSTGTSTGATLSGLALGTTYFWQVRAVNAFGTSEADSGTWWSFTTGSAPGAFAKVGPLDGATGLGLSVGLSWGTAAQAAAYEYCFDTSDDDSCTGWVSAGTATSAQVAVAAGTTYYWQVRATNSFGTTYAGDWWSFATAALPGAFGKSAPVNEVAGVVLNPTLSWGSSSEAVSYEYCYDTTPGDTCDGTWTSSASGTSVELSGLAQDTTYFWQVRAWSASGSTNADAGAWWSFTTGSAPGAFSKTAPADGAAGVVLNPTLSWGSSSGAVSHEYCYDTTPGDTCDGTWTSTATATSVVLSGLDENTTYWWQVRAINPIGTTHAGTWWSFTTATVPGAPESLVAARGDALVTLSWSAPAGDGGRPITDYLIEYRPKGTTTWIPFADGVATGLTATVTGLINGTGYQFRVAAENSVGTGVWSTWVAAAPATTPADPRFLKGLPGDGEVTIAWRAPLTNGGARITDYRIQYRPKGTTTWTTVRDGVSTVRTATVTGLANGTTYQFRVAARNALGRGAWSTVIAITPGLPSPPRALTTTAADQQVTLSWRAPASDGGFALTDYQIQYRLQGTATWITLRDGISTARFAQVTGLTNGIAYEFRVAARNALGRGPWSAVTEGSPLA